VVLGKKLQPKNALGRWHTLVATILSGESVSGSSTVNQ